MNSRMRQTCKHPEVEQTRQPIPQFSEFIEDGKRYDLEEVVTKWSLNIDMEPNEYNWLSPIPMDPESLKVGGIPYVGLASLWLQRRLHDNAAGLTARQYEMAKTEIERQFETRGQHSADSMNRLREYAASPDRIRITSEMARRVMQLRAGVARPSAAVGLLAAVPSIGGIEFFKATRPLCFEQFDHARGIMRANIYHLRNSESLPGVTMETTEDTPYRRCFIDRHGAIIAKHNIAKLTLGNVAMEIVARDSYLADEYGEFGDNVEAHTVMAHMPLSVTPIDTSAYVRVPKEWFETQGLPLPSGYGESTPLNSMFNV